MHTHKQPQPVSDIDLQFIYRHLKLESKYLDFVIECSEKLREYLNPASPSSNAPSSRTEQSPAESESVELETRINQGIQDIEEKISQLRVDPVEQFSSLAEGRLRLAAVLRIAIPESQRPPSLRELLYITPEPMRSKLKELRAETKAKLNWIHSVNSGTQAVLAYTMNYYEKLLNGVLGTEITGQRYSSTGSMSSHMPGIVRTNC